DLGERMKQAFETIFQLGYQKIVIIGSDCYELETADIEVAFELLGETSGKKNKKSIVIGPANDGGYYLLGMQEPFPEIFNEIPWSTSEVLNTTLLKLKQENISYMLLPVLTDIDIEPDLPDDLRIKAGLLKSKTTDQCF
ncbi:MAG: TIGR04282 family arsenosugar biosynthesis glycosyltransferase, partial [Chitinophagaceae bacterium]